MPLEPKPDDEEDFAELLLDCTPWEEDDSAVEEDEDCAELLDDSSELWVGTASEDGGSTPLDAGPDEDDAVGFSMELEDLEVVSEETPSSPDDEELSTSSTYSNAPKLLSNSSW